jgi:hypothetical protein
MRNARHLLIAAAAACLLSAGTALAQQASPEESKIIQAIFGCMAAGLPEDWQHAMMTLDLSAPGAQDGEVRYLVVRGNAAEGPQVFRPCDLRAPAQCCSMPASSCRPRSAAGTACGSRSIATGPSSFTTTTRSN